jgi:hypothetical protein
MSVRADGRKLPETVAVRGHRAVVLAAATATRRYVVGLRLEERQSEPKAE